MIKLSTQERIDSFMAEKRDGNIYFSQKEMRAILAAPEEYKKLCADKDLIIEHLGKQLKAANMETEKAERLIGADKQALEDEKLKVERHFRRIKALETEKQILLKRLNKNGH